MSGLMAEMAAKALKLNIPLSVQLDLTYRCNERCIHCYLDHDDHGEMTTVEIKDLLDQMADAGVFFLTISGGEILMRRDFFEILEHAHARTFSIKLKTNGVLIRKKEAERIRALGVESVQISVYSHRAEVHDAITKMPGSFRQSIEAIRRLRTLGLHVTMANVLMVQNAYDYPGVRALAAELGAKCTLDPTMRRRRCFGHAALQRRPYGLLRFSVRRCLSLRPVSSAQRQRAAHQVCRHLARFTAAQRGSLHPAAGHAFVLAVHAWRNLHPLPGAGLPGRKYARPFLPRLRKILRTDRDSQRELQSKERIPAIFPVFEIGSDSGSATRRAKLFFQRDGSPCSGGLTKFFARLFFCSFVAVPTLDSYFITVSGGSRAFARMEVVRSICSLSFYARVCK
jgi:MoaA/NifB/PqqE/SkfB family radical SAM enzyme